MTFHHHMGTVVETEREIDLLMARTGDAVGLLFDTGHLHFAGGDVLATARRHGRRINHVHGKDIRAEVLHASRPASGRSSRAWSRACSPCRATARSISPRSRRSWPRSATRAGWWSRPSRTRRRPTRSNGQDRPPGAERSVGPRRLRDHRLAGMLAAGGAIWLLAADRARGARRGGVAFHDAPAARRPQSRGHPVAIRGGLAGEASGRDLTLRADGTVTVGPRLGHRPHARRPDHARPATGPAALRARPERVLRVRSHASRPAARGEQRGAHARPAARRGGCAVPAGPPYMDAGTTTDPDRRGRAAARGSATTGCSRPRASTRRARRSPASGRSSCGCSTWRSRSQQPQADSSAVGERASPAGPSAPGPA